MNYSGLMIQSDGSTVGRYFLKVEHFKNIFIEILFHI